MEDGVRPTRDPVRITYSPGWQSLSRFPAGNDDAARRAIIAAQEGTVREMWFNGDVSLRFPGHSFDYPRAPILHHAMALRYALEMLAADGISKFSAPGGSSRPALTLVRHGNNVEIRAGHGGVATVGYTDFVGESARFRRRFIDEITSRFPDLLLNPLIERLFRDSGLREVSRDRSLRHSRGVKLRYELLAGGSAAAAPASPRLSSARGDEINGSS